MAVVHRDAEPVILDHYSFNLTSFFLQLLQHLHFLTNNTIGNFFKGYYAVKVHTQRPACVIPSRFRVETLEQVGMSQILDPNRLDNILVYE